MKVEVKTAMILLGTLLIGGLLGALILGLIREDRQASRERIGRPGGGAQHIEEILQPHDQEQREAIRAVLRKWRERHRMILQQTHRQLRQGLDSMRSELAPLLDDEQRARLDREAERMDRRPPPIGRPDRRPPPPGNRMRRE